MTTQILRTKTEVYTLKDNGAWISVYATFEAVNSYHLIGMGTTWSQALQIILDREQLNAECGF